MRARPITGLVNHLPASFIASEYVAARISRSGRLPLIVLLVEPSGPSVAMRALPDCHPTFSGSPLVLWGPHIIYRTDIDATVAKPIPSNLDRGN